MYTYFGETAPSKGVYKPRRNIKDELSLDEKMAIVWAVTGNCRAFENLRFWKNGKEFFDAFFWENTVGAVCATCRGTYRPDDPFVKINAQGAVQSYTREEVEKAIDDEFDDVLVVFSKLLKEGRARDWYDAFEEVDEE